MDLGLKGKVAFVIGATADIGQEICANYVNEGAKLILTDIVEDKLKKVADACISKGGEVLSSTMDVTNYETVASTVKKGLAKFGRIDILVYVAGLAVPGKFAESDPLKWGKQVDVCLYGFLNAVHTVLPGMVANDYGRIISIMGDSSKVGESGISIAAAARAGQIGLIKSVAKEVGKNNITLNGVALGIIDTTHYGAGFVDKFKEKLVKNYPLGRVGKADDVAPMVVFLSSDRASWITGQIVSVNGGYSMA